MAQVVTLSGRLEPKGCPKRHESSRIQLHVLEAGLCNPVAPDSPTVSVPRGPEGRERAPEGKPALEQ